MKMNSKDEKLEEKLKKMCICKHDNDEFKINPVQEVRLCYI
jgi:hypothetical protein